MSDVKRTDSQRSNTSLKPRVSFNKDVHVKRFGVPPEKFNSLPVRGKKQRKKWEIPSQDGLNFSRRHSDEINLSRHIPPPKYPLFNNTSDTENNLKSKPPKVKRSASDTSGLKLKILDKFHRKRSESETKCDEPDGNGNNKYGLYPIVEVSPPCDTQITSENDLFRSDNTNKTKNFTNTLQRKQKNNNDSNNKNNKNLNNENSKVKRFIPAKAVQIKNKLFKNSDKKSSLLSKEFKYSSLKEDKKPVQKVKKKSSKETRDAKNNISRKNNNFDDTDDTVDEYSPSGEKDRLIKNNTSDDSGSMLHVNSRGHQVSTMVRKLTKERAPPPPMRNNILVTPNVNVAHNNNQPFSYTQPAGLNLDRIHSPTRELNDSSTSKPVIYAQVVVNTDTESGSHKQTIHTMLPTNGKVPYSDSDEGLGFEDSFPSSKKSTSRRNINNLNEDDEYPITPKFKYNNGNFTSALSSHKYSEEPLRNSSFIKITDDIDNKHFQTNGNGFHSYSYESKQYSSDKNNLSHRRDLLESRINSRRIGERRDNLSSPVRNGRNNSIDSLGLGDTYGIETHTKRTTSKHLRNDSDDFLPRKPSFESEDGYIPYNNRITPPFYPEDNNVRSYKSSYKKETRNFDTSRYKNRNDKSLTKDQSHYKSNPEINGRHYDSPKYDDHERFTSETYHDSLRRQKQKHRNNREFVKPKNGYVEYTEERRDKFVDSGIENDLRRDSGDNNKNLPSFNSRLNNESEDEGFVSSLLIASERQHTESNFGTRNWQKPRTEIYEKERKYSPEYRMHTSTSNLDYVHRERSIDDGSHFDPRIDKDVLENGKKTTKKTTKTTKMGTIEKMKQLFTKDKKGKKDSSPSLAREESLRARYKEYKGSREMLNTSSKSHKHWENSKQSSFNDKQEKNKNRMDTSNDNSQSDSTPRLLTPRTSPTRYIDTNGNNQDASTRNGRQSFEKWFKSLDRFSSHKKDKMDKDKSDFGESKPSSIAQAHAKNLCYFGDTDLETEDTLQHKNRSIPPKIPTPSTINRTDRSQSTRNLHSNHSDKSSSPMSKSYKSMQNITDSDVENRGSRMKAKPPILTNTRQNTLKSRSSTLHHKKRNELSSREGSSEGDGSQQSSQRSVVYLHAATVGDIPNPRIVGRRAFSRHDLSSKSSRIQPQVKTLSRSFSVLAPWKPQYGNEIHYDNSSASERRKSSKESNTYQKKKVTHTSSLGNYSKSKENISNTLNRRSKDEPKGLSTTTLYRKKAKQPKENTRFIKSERNIANKSMSIESLGADKSTMKRKDKTKGVSRSVSMPYDSEKSAGWFKKSNRNLNDSHRL